MYKPKNLNNSKLDKPKKIYIKIYYNQTVEKKKTKSILKAAKEMQFITYQGSSVSLSLDFSVEILKPENNKMIYLNKTRKGDIN